MITRQVMKILPVFILFSFFLSGCANFIKPEIGAIAREDARIDLTADDMQEGVFSTSDLVLAYSISESGDMLNISGELSFAQSITYSFGIIERFILKMNFLDEEGRVIETVDITPLINSFGGVPDKTRLRHSSVKPDGASSIAFNYYGVFKGDAPEMGGDTWEIFYFPFE
ncbi:MAG: hypothetical protein WBB23_02910 [Desulforhopalus sp.]